MENFISLVKKYNKVVIQTHDNPDADAIASGFGMKHLMDKLGIDSELIYFGKMITKPNLTAMVRELKVPIINKDSGFKIKDDELLIIVDSQRGSRNVHSFSAKNIACIDHHLPESNYKYVYSNIQSRVGSCSTIVANYLFQLNKGISEEVSTALYFGLLMDTNNFIIKYTNMDKDCREELETKYNKRIITKLVRTSLSFDDIKMLSQAMRSIERYEDVIYSGLGDCDDNLLGHISDLVSEIAGINIVILYSERKDGWKLSIRSYHDYISAEDLVENLTEAIGSGGGHLNKAGGFIHRDKYEALHPDSTFDTHIKIKTVEFYKTLQFYEEGKDDVLRLFGEENFDKVKKKHYNVRYITLSEHFDKKEVVNIRTLEGTVQVPSNAKIVLGAKGEIYPIKEETFNTRYRPLKDKRGKALCDETFNGYGITLNSKDKVIKFSEKDLLGLPLAETTDDAEVFAKKVTGGIKVRTGWGDLYMKNRGYLVYISKDNYYLCDEEVFHLTYQTTDNKVERKFELVK